MEELTILNVPESVLSMKPMQEIRIEYQFEPRDCIDQKLLMKSSDYDVVNVVNETLYAKKRGMHRLRYVTNLVESAGRWRFPL